MSDPDPLVEKVVPFVPPLPPHLPAVEVDGVEPPAPDRLQPEEIEHFRWLLDGLLYGAVRLLLATDACPPSARAAVQEAHELVHDFLVRVDEEVAQR